MKKKSNDLFMLNQQQVIDSIVLSKCEFQKRYSRINDSTYMIIMVKNGFLTMFDFIKSCIYSLHHGENMIYDVDERNFLQQGFEKRYNELYTIYMTICN